MKNVVCGFSLLLLCLMVKVEGQYINSDSIIYTEDVYNQLKDEYSHKEEPLQIQTNHENVDFAENFAEINEVLASHSVPPVEIETFEETGKRLNCEKPWFWNAFKCIWIDIENRNFTARTKRNGKVVAIIAGPPIGIVVLSCCCLICMACIVRSRVKKLKNQIDSLQNRYKPGSIVLPTGEVKNFEPTVEEEEAFDNLLQALVSVV